MAMDYASSISLLVRTFNQLSKIVIEEADARIALHIIRILDTNKTCSNPTVRMVDTYMLVIFSYFKDHVKEQCECIQFAIKHQDSV